MKRNIILGISAFFTMLFFVNGVFADEVNVFPVSTVGSSASCPVTPSYYDPNFCAEFAVVAVCQCEEKAPAGWCSTPLQIYTNLINMFKTIGASCDWAISHGVIPASDREACIDRWNCFKNGGTYDGHACQGNGQPCPGSSI